MVRQMGDCGGGSLKGSFLIVYNNFPLWGKELKLRENSLVDKDFKVMIYYGKQEE